MINCSNLHSSIFATVIVCHLVPATHAAPREPRSREVHMQSRMSEVMTSLAVELPTGSRSFQWKCRRIELQESEVLHMLQDRGFQQWWHHNYLPLPFACIAKPAGKHLDLFARPSVAHVVT